MGYRKHGFRLNIDYIKNGAYFCYCAYLLRMWRYSGFLWVVPINNGIFLRGLKLCKESRTQQMLLVSKMKIGGNHAFLEIIKLQFARKKKTLYIALYF